ncbi:MAG: ribonuclease P protein component [Cyanobium sp.]
MALPQRHRLRGRRVFERLLRQGRRWHGEAMVLRVLPAEAGLLEPRDRLLPASPWRCGVVVSGKVSKRAVVRNRLRRQLHAHLLAVPPRAETPLWLLLSLRPGSAELERDRLLGECSDLLRRAGLTP